MVSPLDLDQLYREHAPVILASLTKAFGPARLDLIEAAVHEAFVAAIEQWRGAIPERPAAWLQTVARRRVIDGLRRAAWFLPDDALADVPAAASEASGDDDLLKMMLVCCHPAIPVEGALALALRTLCGFPVAALCRALLADEAAVEKRLIRARHLEAAIAACHALAGTSDATDWPQIVALYDRLLAVQPSPVVALQRAIAVGRAAGPRQGLRALDALAGDDRLEASAVLAAAAADLKSQLGDARGARAAYRRALELCGTEPERRFLSRKLSDLA